ncbi:MAG TPA: HlyD family efflux transporter periplasmic adaptor subunit [Fimbriiglobus sp.]|nr:HlyD family efflux transporter periplasmic adaptor subunit [Fimbriiglobus sp.]
MVRVRRWVAVVGVTALGLSACNNWERGAGTGPGEKPAPQVVGSPLYTAAPASPAPPVAPIADPIVISKAVVQADLRVQVPAQVDGMIDLIATPLQPGEECDPSLVVYHPRDPETDPAKRQRYRRLRENDVVKAGDVLARLDEQVVNLQIQSSERIIKTSTNIIAEAEKAVKAYDQQRKAIEGTHASALTEVLQMVATVARLQSEMLQSHREKIKAEGELKTAEVQFRKYWVFSPINGRVVKLLKSPQEFAKAGEVILEIQGTDRIRVEGKLDAQYERLVKRGMTVTVEPARPVSPDPHFHSPYHRAEVAGVAVTGHRGRPLIVSAGLDGIALVWDPFGTKPTHALPHPAGVRSVAAAPPGDKVRPWVVTGGDDGKVRLWDLSDPDKLPKEPVTFDESHAAAVTACAFSPDGRFLATAAGRDVFVWDVANRKKLYALPAEHRDAVTSLRFTPQATLVTASRDKSVRVWTLGEQGAATKTVIDHRGGSVDVLGVSADGGKLLFDKDPTRLDVVSLADGRTVGTLQSAGAGARFATLAVFSADGKYVLTAGGEADQRGELTLWAAPQPGGRGAEKLRLVTPRGAAVTCAAFSPDPDKKFMVVGTADGGVHLWTPSAVQAEKPLTGQVVSVLPADARSVTVRVELTNPTDAGEALKDRSLATIIIDPTQSTPAAAPAPAGGRPINAANPDAGKVVQAGGVSAPAAGPSAPLPPAALPRSGVGPRVSPPPSLPIGYK